MAEVDLNELAAHPDYPAGPATLYIGAFEPGNGIPDWLVDNTIPPEEADEIVDEFDDWIDDAFPSPPSIDFQSCTASCQSGSFMIHLV